MHSQGGGPFARQRVHPAFGRRIAGRVSLAGDRNLRADVHDAAARFLKRLDRVVGDGKNVEQVSLQRLTEFRGRLFEADRVVAACVVDQQVKAAKAVQRFLHAALTISFHRQVAVNEVTCLLLRAELTRKR
jgi:hypothetical protein